MITELKITNSNFDTETKDGVTLIDFWAPWCGPCRMQGPIVDKIAEKFAGKAKIGKCNIDEERDLAIKYSVRNIPTLLLFKDGNEIDRMIGLQPEFALFEKINKLVAQ